MKRVLILLIIANVVLYLWRGYSQDRIVETATAPLSPGIERLVLLSEPAPANSGGKQEESGAGESTPAAPLCFTLGPLTRQIDAEQLSRKMARSSIEAVLRKEQTSAKGDKRYLVFIPAMKRDNAKQLAVELKTKGVKDFYVSGQNFIALGVFRNKRGAMKRAEKIKDMGFVTAIKEEGTTSTSIEYWLDARLSDSSTTTPGELDAMLSKYARAQLRTSECGEIALSETKP